MKIVIAGAGAIGGYIGARLAKSGADVVLFGRGAHLQAMRDCGLKVVGAAGNFEVNPQVSGSLAEIGPADLVVLAVKAHSLTDLAPQLRPLFHDDTVVLGVQNGIPWWYFQLHGGELDGSRLDRVDPGGVIAASIEARRIIGAIVYFGAEIQSPGVIRHIEGHRISIGEPDGSRSARIAVIAQALTAAGLQCAVSTNVRTEIWVKLLGNATFNPISALTGATLVAIARHPGASQLVRDSMGELKAVASRLGIEIPITIEQRIEMAAQLGEHKTSMLQDLEAGRRMEVEAVIGAVIEVGERVGIAMPTTRAIYGCVSLLNGHLK